MIHSIQHIHKGACHIYGVVGYLFIFVLTPGSFTDIEVLVFLFIEMQGCYSLASITKVDTLSYVFLTSSEKKMCRKKFA